ncbi:MAG: recombinase family protein [Candidatus Omnitrophica bacterium]|jgi:DNA invertase Pin-like site-specific DNA recombinase|nr:recombinase family protein [Candidatus Omnitrophota bacterium]
MKIAFYIRVPTKDQAKEGYSLEVQREYLESFTKREGLEVFK